jgi:hypothetical protein
MPNEEMISAVRLRKLKKRLLARPEAGKDGKKWPHTKMLAYLPLNGRIMDIICCF